MVLQTGTTQKLSRHTLRIMIRKVSEKPTVTRIEKSCRKTWKLKKKQRDRHRTTPHPHPHPREVWRWEHHDRGLLLCKQDWGNTHHQRRREWNGVPGIWGDDDSFQYSQNISRRPWWRSQSPDLTLNENEWRIVKLWGHQMDPCNLGELKMICQDERAKNWITVLQEANYFIL